MSVCYESPRGVRLAVRVQPRASRNRVTGLQGEAVKVHVTAPPVGGAANAAVVELLAEWLGVPRRSLSVVQGQSGRTKVVEVETDEPERLRRRVQEALGTLVDKEGRRA